MIGMYHNIRLILMFYLHILRAMEVILCCGRAGTSDPKVAWKHFHLDFLGKYLVSKICLEVKYGLGSLPNGVHL